MSLLDSTSRTKLAIPRSRLLSGNSTDIYCSGSVFASHSVMIRSARALVVNTEPRKALGLKNCEGICRCIRGTDSVTEAFQFLRHCQQGFPIAAGRRPAHHDRRGRTLHNSGQLTTVANSFRRSARSVASPNWIAV